MFYCSVLGLPECPPSFHNYKWKMAPQLVKLYTIKGLLWRDPFTNHDCGGKNVYHIPASSRYVKCLPFGSFFVKRHKAYTLGRPGIGVFVDPKWWPKCFIHWKCSVNFPPKKKTKNFGGLQRVTNLNFPAVFENFPQVQLPLGGVLIGREVAS